MCIILKIGLHVVRFIVFEILKTIQKYFKTFIDGIIKVHDNMKIRLEKIRFYKLKLSISFGR